MRRCVWLMLMIGSTNFDVCDDRYEMTSTRMTIKGSLDGFCLWSGSLGLGGKIHINIHNF
jgi:hypothetical protein